MMFVGRSTELNMLETLYRKDVYQLVAVYGHRRMGKTALLSRFAAGKPAIFFSAQETNDKMNIRSFSKKVFDFFNIPNLQPAFESWGEVFAFIAEKAKLERFILVIDGFPHAANQNKNLTTVLQETVDNHLKKTNIFIILCGDQISFMGNEVLGYKSPLFGRRTAQLQIRGLGYVSAAQMLGAYTTETKIEFYACIGGAPHYLAQIDRTADLRDNLARLYFNTSGFLYDEPTMILKQELRELAMYNAILSAIAEGAERLSEISAKVCEDRSKTIKYLEILMNLQILYKEVPVGQDPGKSRKSIYKIADPCYRFWYRYVFPHRAEIEQGFGEEILESILPGLDEYVSKSFEEICLQYMIRKNNNRELPFFFVHSGKWWGNHPETKAQVEIDLLFDSFDHKSVIFAECIWQTNKPDLTVLDDLIEKSTTLQGYQNRYFYLFSRTDFSNSCKMLAEQVGRVKLISLSDLFE